MPPPPEPTERMTEKSKEKLAAIDNRVTELERTVKALLVAVKQIENEIDEPAMPEGVYYGETFED